MCGRFVSKLTPEILARLFGTINPLPNLRPSYNVAPRQDAAAVRRHPATGARHLDTLNWGLLPHFTKDAKAAPRPINARAEGLAANGLFRGAFAARRCIIPVDAFYEWQVVPGGTPSKPAKQAWAIAREDGAPLAFAGLWEGWKAPDGGVVRSFAIVTNAAGADTRWLHERVPVVLDEADWPAWLGEIEGNPAELLRAPATGVLKFWKVSDRVNSVRNDGPELLEAVSERPGALPLDPTGDKSPDPEIMY